MSCCSCSNGDAGNQPTEWSRSRSHNQPPNRSRCRCQSQSLNQSPSLCREPARDSKLLLPSPLPPFAAAAAADVAVALVLTVCCWRCCCGWIDSVHQIDNNNAHVSKIEFKYTYARVATRVKQLSNVRGRSMLLITIA